MHRGSEPFEVQKVASSSVTPEWNSQNRGDKIAPWGCWAGVVGVARGSGLHPMGSSESSKLGFREMQWGASRGFEVEDTLQGARGRMVASMTIAGMGMG
jgi:hypothetical protein